MDMGPIDVDPWSMEAIATGPWDKEAIGTEFIGT
jgi:hypothetical protein